MQKAGVQQALKFLLEVCVSTCTKEGYCKTLDILLGTASLQWTKFSPGKICQPSIGMWMVECKAVLSFVDTNLFNIVFTDKMYFFFVLSNIAVKC